MKSGVSRCVGRELDEETAPVEFQLYATGLPRQIGSQDTTIRVGFGVEVRIRYRPILSLKP